MFFMAAELPALPHDQRMWSGNVYFRPHTWHGYEVSGMTWFQHINISCVEAAALTRCVFLCLTKVSDHFLRETNQH
jgi:hypothetical protein